MGVGNLLIIRLVLSPSELRLGNFRSNKNARHPKEAHIARNLKEIKILDRAGEDLKELDQH